MSQILSKAKSCLHCRLDVPKDRNSDFCCAGCECVYKTINGLGLDNFYEITRKLEIDLISPNEYRESFDYLDHDLFFNDYVVKHDNGVSSIRFHVDGIHCAACVWLLENLSSRISGVEEIRVNFPRSEIVINYYQEKIKLSKVAQTIASLGYYVRPAGAESKKIERKQMLIRLGIAGVCAGNTMMLAISVYQGWFTGMEQGYVNLFNYLGLILAIPSVFYCARPFYVSAWQGLKLGIAHMDLPISIGVFLGFITSCWNTFQGSDHVYFDTICMLVFLLLLGRWLQRSGVDKAEQYSDACESLLPLVATRLNDNMEENVYFSSILPGDLIRARTGERLIADGIVKSGVASLDLSVLTGESLPKKFSVGDSVEAGTLVYSGSIDVEVKSIGSSTRIGRLLELTEIELLTKPNLVKTTDKIAGSFVLVVLGVTFLCAAYWISKGSYKSALENCLAILIISCPCALGMSAPIAISLALKLASKLGIAIKNSDIFEKLAVVKNACLDKTGTLTIGRPKVEQVYFSNPDIKSQIIDLCYTAELEQEHPVASALRLYCIENNAQTLKLEIEKHSSGLIFKYQQSNYFLGSLKWIEDRNVKLNIEQNNFCKKALSANLSPCMLATAHEVLAIFAICDSIKADAKEFVETLSKQGIVCEIVSGDSQEIVNGTAKVIGIPLNLANGEMSPEDKLSYISKIKESSLMLGDGVNDSAALAVALVGIAVFGGAEQSLKFADAYTNSAKLMPIADLIDLSKSTLAVIKRNIAFSICYNVFGVGLAFFGFVNPLIAAVLMPISSLGVIASSLMIVKRKKYYS